MRGKEEENGVRSVEGRRGFILTFLPGPEVASLIVS